MPTTYPENYRAHWRGHWPAVVNLGVVVLIEWWISRELNYGLTPFALIPGLDPQGAETAWTWLLSLLFLAMLARYVSGRTHRLPGTTETARAGGAPGKGNRRDSRNTPKQC